MFDNHMNGLKIEDFKKKREEYNIYDLLQQSSETSITSIIKITDRQRIKAPPRKRIVTKSKSNENIFQRFLVQLIRFWETDYSHFMVWKLSSCQKIICWMMLSAEYNKSPVYVRISGACRLMSVYISFSFSPFIQCRLIPWCVCL